ncbi:hypothetical protein BLNAU_1893 [Blattamonas nauphoetae]|uniref:Uncharacterized protein n=1 Tax=Blattamonas nauphoetae TaxID=2049346 RepID=A0ABQ9YHY5_9EUKA|nr:hypothetical protein BLNAU_1893 [Blattamonas nauphoetae]
MSLADAIVNPNLESIRTELVTTARILVRPNENIRKFFKTPAFSLAYNQLSLVDPRIPPDKLTTACTQLFVNLSRDGDVKSYLIQQNFPAKMVSYVLNLKHIDPNFFRNVVDLLCNITSSPPDEGILWPSDFEQDLLALSKLAKTRDTDIFISSLLLLQNFLNENSNVKPAFRKEMANISKNELSKQIHETDMEHLNIILAYQGLFLSEFYIGDCVEDIYDTDLFSTLVGFLQASIAHLEMAILQTISILPPIQPNDSYPKTIPPLVKDDEAQFLTCRENVKLLIKIIEEFFSAIVGFSRHESNSDRFPLNFVSLDIPQLLLVLLRFYFFSPRFTYILSELFSRTTTLPIIGECILSLPLQQEMMAILASSLPHLPSTVPTHPHLSLLHGVVPVSSSSLYPPDVKALNDSFPKPSLFSGNAEKIQTMMCFPLTPPELHSFFIAMSTFLTLKKNEKDILSRDEVKIITTIGAVYPVQLGSDVSIIINQSHLSKTFIFTHSILFVPFVSSTLYTLIQSPNLFDSDSTQHILHTATSLCVPVAVSTRISGILRSDRILALLSPPTETPSVNDSLLILLLLTICPMTEARRYQFLEPLIRTSLPQLCSIHRRTKNLDENMTKWIERILDMIIPYFLARPAFPCVA